MLLARWQMASGVRVVAVAAECDHEYTDGDGEWPALVPSPPPGGVSQCPPPPRHGRASSCAALPRRSLRHVPLLRTAWPSASLASRGCGVTWRAGCSTSRAQAGQSAALLRRHRRRRCSISRDAAVLGWPPRASYLAHALLCGVPALCLVSAALLSLNMGRGLLCRRQREPNLFRHGCVLRLGRNRSP